MTDLKLKSNSDTHNTRSKRSHSYSMWSAISGNFHVEMSRTNQWLFSFSIIGAKIGIVSPLELLPLEGIASKVF